MNLLQQLIAAAREGRSLDTAETAPAASPVDADYAAYLAEFARIEAARPVCKRCGGHGYIRGYEHINGGRCFRCDGYVRGTEKPLTYRAWVAERAAQLDLGGFEVMVQE